MACVLEKSGLAHQNALESDMFALLLGTLVMDRRQQFESIDVALDME